MRTVPGEGLLVVNGADANLKRVLEMGCWSGVEYFDDPRGWTAQRQGQGFEVALRGIAQGQARTPMAGAHNRSTPSPPSPPPRMPACCRKPPARPESFRGIKRRLELRGEVRGVQVYDDFAHHPTAIAVTIAALREQLGEQPVTARAASSPCWSALQHHAPGRPRRTLADSLRDAALSFVYARPDLKWDAQGALGSLGARLRVHGGLEALVADAVAQARPGDRCW